MNETATRMQQRLELPAMIAALMTIPAVFIEQESSTIPTSVIVLNWLIWLVFLTEMIIMLRVVDDRRAWLRDHPLEIAIVVLTPPFLPASMQAARALRLLRLLRFVRLAALVRRVLSTEGVRDVSVLAMMTVLGGGAAFAAAEREAHLPEVELTTWDGVWWAVVTVTTVGYGDISARTDMGRVIAIIVMFVGIGFIAILTAAAAERFMRSHRESATRDALHDPRIQEVLDRLTALEVSLSGGAESRGDASVGPDPGPASQSP